MAEKEEGHANAHKRNTHSSRGHPGQNRLYSQLGVKDLRELLDRKRHERGQVNEASIPPPDPSYNYLKDPLRENYNETPHEQPVKHNTRKYYNKNNPSNNYKRDKESQSGNAGNHPKNRDIENPLNIKVEFSTATGEHVYKMDETTVLPTIKHVPDRMPTQNRSFRQRGRGRGRGQQRTYSTRTIRSNNMEKKTPHSSNDKPITPDVSNAEENWDEELNENRNPVENADVDKEVFDDSHEEHEEHNLEETGEGSLEASIQNLDLNESKSQNENLEKSEINEKAEEKVDDSSPK